MPTEHLVTLHGERYVITRHDDGTFELPPELARWSGHGTALKPAWEPILVYRKPLEESTIARQVLATGTGGLNIDATRVKHASPADLAKHTEMVERIKERGGSMANSWKNSSDLSGASDVKTEGRWPSNLVLCHHPDCRRVGTQEVQAPVINRFDDGMKPFGDGAGHPYTSSGGGTEEVAVYECVDGREFTASAFVSGSTVCSTPLSPLSSLLGHVAVVLRDLRGCNRPCTTPLPDASEVARILHTQSGVSDDVLAHEVARALGVSALPDWRACCAPCRGLCGGHVRRFVDAAQVGPQLLADALEHALRDLPKLEHTLGSPTLGPQSSSDAVLGSGTEHGSPPSRTSSVRGRSTATGRLVVTAHRSAIRRRSLRLFRWSRVPSADSRCERRGRVMGDSACRHAEIRLLGLVALDLASCFLSVECRKIVPALGMCPVKMLDEQSGELRTNAGTVTSDMASMGYHGGLGSARQVVADAGGASRFFPSFHGQEPPAAPFMYTSKASRKETTLDGVVENNHPTKKPLALMEWLVKLVCPKGGVVLDPYCGSGTTCVAATLHDMHFTGIEKDEKYHAIACKRVGIVYEQQEYERAAKSVFDFMEQIDAELGDDEDMYGGLRR